MSTSNVCGAVILFLFLLYFIIDDFDVFGSSHSQKTCPNSCVTVLLAKLLKFVASALMVLALTFIVNFVVYPVLELYVYEVSPYHVSSYRAASIEFLLDEDFEIDTFALELFHADIPLSITETHVSLYLSAYFFTFTFPVFEPNDK